LEVVSKKLEQDIPNRGGKGAVEEDKRTAVNQPIFQLTEGTFMGKHKR